MRGVLHNIEDDLELYFDELKQPVEQWILEALDGIEYALEYWSKENT